MFYNTLERMGRTDILTPPRFRPPEYYRRDAVIAIAAIIKENKRVLIYRDYDPDGAFTGEILIETFNRCGFKNYETYKYTSRTHKVDQGAISQAFRGDFDYLIVCDAGSSDPEVLNRVELMGVKVIVVDHHPSIYGYEDFKITGMINTAFENRRLDKDILLSAGGVMYTICLEVLSILGVSEPETLAPLALVSLYADSIDMSNELNRSIYYKAVNCSRNKLPAIIQRFMEDYTFFTKRFIQFNMTPRINSLFRGEEFSLLNSLLDWKPGSGVDLPELMTTIADKHNFYRSEYETAAHVLEVEELNNFVIGDLQSAQGYCKIPPEKLYHYTGLVANLLSTKYNKTAIVYADSGTGIKGSLRDKYSRNYIEIFRTFSHAEGHNAAFAIMIPYREFRQFRQYLDLIDDKYSIKSINNSPIITRLETEVDPALVFDMATYNEFSGINTPEALFVKEWKTRVSPSYGKNSYYKRYKHGEFVVKSRELIRPFSEILLKPYISKEVRGIRTPELMVEGVTG